CRFREIYEKGEFKRLESLVKIVGFKIGLSGRRGVGVNVDIEGKAIIDIYNYDEKVFVGSMYICVVGKDNE
ncbi:hypothetical protein, partial [Bacillus altitudinis]|uniref:hypothetical protein n=1 Tax=Bacillus altitudinis TaxID=293387 RepID=UPI001643DA9E